MRLSKMSWDTEDRLTVTEVEEFLRRPPAGFTVHCYESGYSINSDTEKNVVLIDDFNIGTGNIVFTNSLRRKVKLHNLGQYTSVRKSLLSKRIYLLLTAWEQMVANNLKDLKYFVVSIDGRDPYIKWQMERGLDWATASVAGESYRVNIDLTEALQTWSSKALYLRNNRQTISQTLVWSEAFFTLKYYSDAMFDFPYWFGFSKRAFKLKIT
ncbi:mesenteric estrogen-dependent adipogenesis protein-like [Boleophthalmus pectinirostris]|uniref:mesenteric estrogen-dependent adipogenesis protein-like n=1 Tax=Boleophthalmus pectinirostris TaxID=150288 RepID=UPI00242E48AF|nr:mesenteric estrogen-dependent adipogenesis protein-like [Boleophthalmus pectinirostris]